MENIKKSDENMNERVERCGGEGSTASNNRQENNAYYTNIVKEAVAKRTRPDKPKTVRLLSWNVKAMLISGIMEEIARKMNRTGCTRK